MSLFLCYVICRRQLAKCVLAENGYIWVSERIYVPLSQVEKIADEEGFESLRQGTRS
jgi:hypothetical protein